MELSKEEYARKRIYNGFSVRFKNSVIGIVMPNSFPRGGIFYLHITTIKYSYILDIWL